MIVVCKTCGETYDDLDHLTYCPHNYFKKLSFEEICKLNDIDNNLPIGTTESLIKAMI